MLAAAVLTALESLTGRPCGLYGMVTPELCLNFLGYCSSLFGTQYVVLLELPKQGKLRENRWRQRTP